MAATPAKPASYYAVGILDMSGKSPIGHVYDTQLNEFIQENVPVTATISYRDDGRGYIRNETSRYADIKKNIKQIAAESERQINEDDKPCTGLVSEYYINKSLDLNGNNIYMIAVDKATNTVNGFLIGKFATTGAKSAARAETYGYIDIVCGKGSAGSNLLNIFMGIANTKKCDYVELSSLTNVLAYYPRLGFEHRKTCSIGENPISISAAFAAFDVPGTVEEKKGLTEFKNNMRTMNGTRLANYLQTEAPEALKEFILELNRLGFTAKKSNGCPTATDWNTFITNGCHIDGFKMRKCTPQMGGTRKGRKNAVCRKQKKTRRGRKTRKNSR